MLYIIQIYSYVCFTLSISWTIISLYAELVFMLLFSSTDFFLINLSKISFKNTIRVSNCSEPDQDRHSVSPDPGPNCLQRLSTDHSSRISLFLFTRLKCMKNYTKQSQTECQTPVDLLDSLRVPL